MKLETWNLEHGTWNLLWILILLCAGCDLLAPETEDPAPDPYIVESYLIAGEEMKQVRVMEPSAVGDSFDVSEMGVSGAAVEIALLTESGQVDERYSFREASESDRGVYVPTEEVTIRPLHTYRLEVTPSNASSPITATTTVPDTFSLTPENTDTVTYGEGEVLPIRVTESDYPDRQNYYLINNIPQDVREEQLTPAGRDLFDGTESMMSIGNDGYTLTSLSQNEWPITNASSYPHRGDGTLTVQYPWLSMLFYGENRIDVHVIDDNVYDYIRSNNAQTGGANPGQVPNVIDHVEGGTGLFGSMARVRYDVYVEERRDR